MELLRPKTPEELGEALAAAARGKKRITLGGAFTKNRMGQPPEPADVTISTAEMTRVVQYEPRDLTISVEAGLPFAELNRMAGEHGQMAPLDPPYYDQATVGGVVAANTNGPRRRLYGACRDLVIGMKFATLQGKLIQSGGMVVKNVAGLDMAKLMIGSFGTLAALAVVNFRLVPAPLHTCTYASSFTTAGEAFAARDALLKSYLQPAAMDILNPAAAARIGWEGYLLLVQVGGSPTVLGRYARELGGVAIGGEQETALWRQVREFAPDFLAEHPEGAVTRVSCTLLELAETVREMEAPVVVRAGSGVCYGFFADAAAGVRAVHEAARRGRKAVIECVPAGARPGFELWPDPGSDFVMMEKIKQMFDPDRILNRGRLYGRL
jgi:glycolate oxidase FAD binding subunit